jgi:hypothetical protein
MRNLRRNTPKQRATQMGSFETAHLRDIYEID